MQVKITELKVELANKNTKIAELERKLQDAYAEGNDARQLARERLQELDAEKASHQKERQETNRRIIRAVPTTAP